MIRRTRRILLWSIILFFIIIAPSMLFYAWGYSFDWQKKKPVLTGGFYFKSIPSGAEIYLNDKLKDRTPAFIKRLLPRDYQVRITKQEFHPWQKKLKVESEKVTEARNIFLVPLNLNFEIVNDNLVDDFLLKDFLAQEKSNDIFYIQETTNILYRTDPIGQVQEQLSLSPLPANRQYEVFASPNKKISALSDNQELYLLNPQTKNFELISQEVQGIEFAQDNKKLLYFTPSEIWVYYLEDIVSPPNKKAGEKELITRLSQKIKQAIWYSKTNEHIILSVGSYVKFAELDGRDQRNIADIINLEINQIGYNQQDKKLYVVINKKLFKVSLE